MAFRNSDVFDRRMLPVSKRVNTFRWWAILFGSVFILVVFLLRPSTQYIDSDVSYEVAERLNAEASQFRWSIPRAQSWFASQPWYIGANYLPSTAVNVLEMWQDTFDEETIQRELKWASQRLRMNALRVFIHVLVWMDNPTKFFQRLDTFLNISSANNLKVMLVLFDECWNPNPRLGQQPQPIPGVHNSQWVRCPGQAMLTNKTTWPILTRYTNSVIHRYKSDDRIFAWDLYNEPECSKQVSVVLPLLRHIHQVARSVSDVTQPMTIGIAKWPLTTPLATFELAVSDIISFHSYGTLANVIQNITDLRQVQKGRPIFCTEWLARPFGSTVFTHLNYFSSEEIGAIQWGLVAGRSQTYYQWKSPKDAPMPQLWFHDVFYRNGTPFSELEEKFYFDLRH